MGLLHRKEEVASSVMPYYTTGQQKIFLVVGLGNPGKEFERTRHNIGFEVLDYLAQVSGFEPWVNKKDLKCQLTSVQTGGAKVVLCKPQTMMNLSGEAAASVQRFYRIPSKQIVAVYDDLTIEFGSIRARVGGESAGHNGIKSLIQYLGEDFGRLRIGISSEVSKKAATDSFVLGKFNTEEQAAIPLIIKEASSMLSEYTATGELPHDTRKIMPLD